MQTSFVCFFSSTPGSWHDRHVSGSDPHLRMILAQLYRFDSSAVWSWDVGCIGYMGSIVDRPIDPSGSDSWNSNSLLPTEVCQRMASTRIEDDRSSKNTRCIFSRILVTIVFFHNPLCLAGIYMHKQREFPFKRVASSASNVISIYVFEWTQNYNPKKLG